MEKYLFSLDLDDTLLNKKHQLSKKTIKYINKVSKVGHYFVINTGRPKQGMMQFKNKLKIDCPYICNNGGIIYYDNNKDFPKYFPINQEILKQFYIELKPFIFAMMMSADNKIIFSNRKFVPEFMIHIDKDTIVIEDDIINNIDNINNISLSVYSDKFEEVNEILNKYSPYISYRNWGKYDNIISLELYSSDCSKGNALLYLKKYLNISKNHTIAFGDSNNDIDMLLKADIGVAMKNAKDSLKEKTSYITYKNNHRNGVIHFIDKILKNKIHL